MRLAQEATKGGKSRQVQDDNSFFPCFLDPLVYSSKENINGQGIDLII